MSTTFDALPLRPELLESLRRVGFVEATPIQAQALPALLQGKDLTGQAKTGSGKTAAFGLALLQRVETAQLQPQALVLCPTRELAEQVATELRRLAQCMADTRILTVTGGRPFRDQKQGLLGGSHVVVGTPGRIAKHLRTGSLELGALRVLVLDEADRMLDMGFSDEVMGVVEQCPAQRQTMLLSATMPQEIRDLSNWVQRDPLFVAVESQVAPEQLQQQVFHCPPGQRNQTLVDLLTTFRPTAALVFCETRRDCDRIAAFLSGRGALALALHGDMEQRDRDDVLLRFGNGSASVLVATNVAARGLDIPLLPLVIIAELSPDPESHVHRVGRTGRAGQQGMALSIVSGSQEQSRLEQIEAFTGQVIPHGPELTGTGGLAFLAPPNRTLFILAGRKDKLRKGDVLGALVKEAGVPPDAIGRIDLRPKICAVAVARPHAQQALDGLRSGRIKKKKVRVRLSA